MQIKEIKNKQDWKEFILKQEYTLFVQSPHYGDFFEKQGEQYWIFGIYEGKKLIGGSLCVSTHAKRGDFLYLPYGPVVSEQPHPNPPLKKRRELDQILFQEFMEYVKDFAKKNGFDFVRVSPFIDNNKENKKLFKSAGYRTSPIHILAENTWLLDLENKSEEDLLMDMNKNHRNLIRRCEREGVRIKKSIDEKDLKEYNELIKETAKRHNFHPFSDKYVKNEFTSFAPHDQALILHAYLPDGTLDSSAIVYYYGNMAAYRHGASLMTNKKIPTSYLLQWEAIKEAKKRGMKWYNFWGIAPDKAKKSHPFRGITHFKKGFGGYGKNLLWCQDLPLTSKYWLNWIVETIRRKKRGF